MTPPDLDTLAQLARSDDLGDRAFANGALRLRYGRLPDERERTRAAYDDARACALRFHAKTRAALKDGSLRGAALRALLEAHRSPDAFVEELLDLAYPPLDEAPLPPLHTPYVASGVAEVLHALDATRLGPDDTLVDLGAGLGKVVLLARLLTGAHTRGVELDGTLVRQARERAEALGIDGVEFVQGDAREADLGEAKVYYLFSPFAGEVLDTVMTRLESLAARRALYVCASPAPYPWLTPVSPPRSWLVVHRSVLAG